LTIGERGDIMVVVTTRETVHALLDRYPDDELDALAEFLSCRRSANGTDLSAKGIRERDGSRPLTPEEFKQFMAEYGPHMGPPDDEG
jgi:hypothetical protein